jgi:hypothetical protein
MEAWRTANIDEYGYGTGMRYTRLDFGTGIFSIQEVIQDQNTNCLHVHRMGDYNWLHVVATP